MRGQTYTIGVMLPDIRNPFFADILDGVTEQLRRHRLPGAAGPGCNDEEAEAQVTDAMIDRSMDGLILIAPISPRAHLRRTSPAPCPPSSSAGTAARRLRHRRRRRLRRRRAGRRPPRRPRPPPHRPHRAPRDRPGPARRRCPTPSAPTATGTPCGPTASPTRSTSRPPRYTQEGGYLGAQQLLARDAAADGHLRRRRHRRHGRARRARRGRAVGPRTTSPSPATTTPCSPPSARSR